MVPVTLVEWVGFMVRVSGSGDLCFIGWVQDEAQWFLRPMLKGMGTKLASAREISPQVCRHSFFQLFDALDSNVMMMFVCLLPDVQPLHIPGNRTIDNYFDMVIAITTKILFCQQNGI